MRIALIVAAFVVVFAMALVALPITPAAGQTVPPPTAPPCAGDCGPIPTPRPTASVSPTPDPGCTDDCGPIPTPRPDMGTPSPGCDGECFPWPTPRPTYIPGATIEAAEPPAKQIWFYGFMPIMGR